jgi:hypothetical protein
MTRIKAIVCIYPIPKGLRTYVCKHHVTTDDSAITKVTAIPIPNDVSTLDDTPRKGHIPRNCESTTLFTKIAPIIMANSVTTGTEMLPVAKPSSTSAEIFSPISIFIGIIVDSIF